MKAIKKILVPTDFSDNASVAYIHAQDLATKFDATVDFIHIVPTLQYFSESISRLDATLELDEEIYPTAQKDALHKIGQLMENYIKTENKGEPIVKIARKPAVRIAEIANELNYDLIVMSFKGRHETDLLRGSTAIKVIRNSVIPVLTVNEDRRVGQVERIMLPTDGSELSLTAFSTACQFAAKYRARLVLFHLVELYGYGIGERKANPAKSSQQNTYETLMEHLNNYLKDNWQERFRLQRMGQDFVDQIEVLIDGETPIEMETLIQRGSTPHRGIEEFAPEHADMIVMATHGHSGLAQVILGSTTEQVVQHVNMPVITVKPKGGNM